MQFKDYYAILGVEESASQDEIKRAYRKLARKYHPDVSKEADAETRFKEISEANEALSDPERRAAYDEVKRRHQRGQDFEPGYGADPGFEFSGRGAGFGDATDFSDFFEAIFGRGAGRAGGGGHPGMRAQGNDHHAKVVIDLEDAYRGARRTISLRMPVVDAHGHATMRERQLDVNIPKGVREGQHLRLSGQGAAGLGGGPAGDLYLEIAFNPHPRFRVDGRDVYVDLPVTPWEAALGASVAVPTPDGEVQMNIPADSRQGRKLRLRGRGLPGKPAGDLYVVITISLPPADLPGGREAYAAMAKAFAGFDPRRA
ncbi:DnaJ C-terminal domain-containing protein [Piscinibacter sakaiensis]|uniref:DnaJ C-terminal domain-containing protein n=1 Tax=Piscinibacter sakaiensis TaxID=1547922 RepID=UPI003AAF0409